MATIYNSDLTKELKDGIKIQQNRDVIPSQLADKVVPVMEVNPKLFRRSNICVQNVASNSASATIYTTPTDKDFYLVAVGISVSKDITATSTYSAIELTVDGGGTANVFNIAGLTLTPQSGAWSWALPVPIRIARGTTIKIVNSTNVGNVRSYGQIVGYTVDNINA
jgi:hypothetical protein